MTWKLYAAVSAGAFAATYLMSSPQPPPHAAAPVAAVRAMSARQMDDAADIAQLADRLQARVHEQIEYQKPGRDPFRFAARVAQPVAALPPKPVVVDLPPPVPVLPLVKLSGIAADRGGKDARRTAVLSTPAGVFLVKEGETVGGIYRVVSIGEDSVELEAIADGSHRTLQFSR